MAERVLNTPLSGEEIVQAIGQKVMTALRRDCYLTPNLAYDYYSANIKISLTAHDIGRDAVVNTEVEDTQGEISEDENALLDQADAEFKVDAEEPNRVRVESGQPVPVLARGGDGKQEIKGVKYSRKALEKVAK